MTQSIKNDNKHGFNKYANQLGTLRNDVNYHATPLLSEKRRFKNCDFVFLYIIKGYGTDNGSYPFWRP